MTHGEISDRVRELLRRGAEAARTVPEAWLDKLDQAVLQSEGMAEVAGDPVLLAGTRRANRSVFSAWVESTVLRPGEPVEVRLSDHERTLARDFVRRGLHESAIASYRAAQAAAWTVWMRLAFAVTDDVDELRALLQASHHSINQYVEAVVLATEAVVQEEREALTRGTSAERREMVALLLDGAPVSQARAERVLGYRLSGPHTAAVLWTEDPDADAATLDEVVQGLATLTSGGRPLAVLVGHATRWLWARGWPAIEDLERVVARVEGARLAVGTPSSELEGFRRSHHDALRTQRVMDRLASHRSVVRHAEIELAALVADDPEPAERFVRRVLGDLVTADPTVADSLRVFIAERCTASRAAERLYVHRNTMLRRLAAAEELLPRPLDDDLIAVAAALEVLRWHPDAAMA